MPRLRNRLLASIFYALTLPVARADPPLRPVWPPANESVRTWAVDDAADPSRATPITWYGDVIDLYETLKAPAPYAARAQIDRSDDGPAVFIVRADGEFELWVNERPLGRFGGGPVLGFHTIRVPVSLLKGANRVRIRMPGTAENARLSLLVGEAGARPEPSPPVIAIAATPRGVAVRVAPHAPGRPREPVKIVAVRADGTVVATRSAIRGGQAAFDTAAWRDGAYEFRAESSGSPALHAYASYYKGEPRAALQGLMQAAQQAPAGVRGDHLRLLAAVAADRLGGPAATASPRRCCAPTPCCSSTRGFRPAPGQCLA